MKSSNTMKRFIVLAFLILLSYFGKSLGNNWEPCGSSWKQYKDEKCFQIIENDHPTQSFDNAIKKCASLEDSSTLAMIQSTEEHKFLSNFLFKIHRKVDNFWIGGKYSNTSNSFKWLDNSELSFTNWDSNYPSRRTGNSCVLLQSDEGAKWKNEYCDRRYAVVCQKMQFWSIERLQKKFLSARQKLSFALSEANKKIQSLENERLNSVTRQLFDLKEETLTLKLENVTKDLLEAKNQLKNAEKKIDDLKNNHVPIGFIYVQLSNQQEPENLWPNVQWKEVTSEYAGLFFRAEGGGSEQFGTVQAENAPRVTEVRREYYFWSAVGETWNNTTLTVGGASSGFGIFSGVGNAYDGYTHRFYQSEGEVRPRNTAMRVWKRIK